MASATPTGGQVVRALLRGSTGSLVGLVVASSISGMSEAGFLVLITRAAFAATESEDEIALLGGRVYSIGIILLLALLLIIIRLIAALLATRQIATIQQRVLARTRKDLAHAYLHAPWSAQQSRQGGQLQELLTTYANNVLAIVGQLTAGMNSALNLIALFVFALFVNPVAAAIVGGVVAVLGIALRPIRNAVRRQGKRQADVGMRFATSISAISGLGLETQVFRVQQAAEASAGASIDEYERHARRLTFLRGVVPIVYSVLAYLALVAAVALLSLTDAGDITDFGAVFILMLRSLSYGQNLQTMIAGFVSSLPYAGALRAELDELHSVQRPQAGDAIGEITSLRFDHVSFSYDEAAPTLHDIDLTFETGEIVGIIGPSGSGKTTLTHLLLRLREPTDGRVLINGTDARRLDPAEWARRVTFVPQDARLIEGSVADNIRFLREWVTDDQIEAAASAAGLHRDVVEWEHGYERRVGAGDGQLSGGQRQRLSIARALVENPDVLVLDEPTSALDGRSEALVRDTLERLAERMIVVVVAHRMSTLDICSRLVVIESGRIAADDPPDVLHHTSRFYSETMLLSDAGSS